MPVKKVANLSEFNAAIASQKLTVVDAFAEWCPPCKMIAPHFHKLSDENADVQFVSFDVDNARDVASFCNIKAMPTFIFFKGGKEIDRMQGANPGGLTAKVNQHK